MNEYRIRPATRRDRSAIRRLVWKVRINPFRLHWRNFIVAVSGDGTIVGCGQLKPHGTHTTELASIAVEEEYRKRGVARALIDQLSERASRPLYLVCLPMLCGFYTRFGFEIVDSDPLPRHFAGVRRMSRIVRLLHRSRAPVVMRLD